MRKVLVMLFALLMVSPAMAMTVSVVDGGSGWAEIQYDASGEAELPRAFALNISVDTGTIDDVAFPGGAGDSACATCEPFDIFPGTIVIDANVPEVTDYGTPVAPADAPDSPGQLGTSAIVVEMGSLYDPEGDTPPAASGLLLKVLVSENCTLTVSEEDTVRGGVVMEDATGATVADASTAIAGPVTECYAGQPDYDEWVAVGSPECWCYPRQCHGDADGLKGGDPFGGYYYVGSLDLGILVDAWKVKEDPFGPGIESVPNGACADFDHAQGGDPFGGYYRVGSLDLGILVDYWKVKEDPFGPGVPGDCQPGNVTP